MNNYLSLANFINGSRRNGRAGTAGRLRLVRPLNQTWERLTSVTRWGSDRAAHLAQVISARYAVRSIPQPSLDFAYRRYRPVVNMQAILQHTQVQLAPRLAFTLVNRLLRRTERFEAGEPARTPVATGLAAPPLAGVLAYSKSSSGGQPAALPVPRIVRRPVTVTVADPEQQTPETPAVGSVRRSPVGPEPNRPVSLPIDVNRLTDQVIQTIDRRIIAQRERLGRV